MPNLMNPLGNRLGKKLYWRGAHPFVYNIGDQFKYFEIIMSLRLLVSIFFTRVLRVQPRVNATDHMHGLLVRIVVNIWGASSNCLSVFVRLFDYKLVTLLLETKVRQFFIERFGQALFNFSKFFKSLRASFVQSLPAAGLGFLFEFRGQTILRRFRSFIRNYFEQISEILFIRIRRWHQSVILFTQPYLRWLMRKHSFEKFMFFTTIDRGSLSSAMLVRYMLLKLRQGFTLTSVIRNARSGINQVELSGVLGYKICCSGRFTRKQIATYRWFRTGYLCLNQLSGVIDYAQGRGVSKHGAYGIKLWFYYG